MMNGMNRLRLGGINSGIDTEAIVKAMSGATQLRINNNKRRVLMLQAQQNAYRDVISKLQNFQNTYFNVVNRDNFLKSSALFTRTSSSVFTTTSGVDVKGAPSGVTVTSATGAAAGTYNVTLVKQASQATLTGTDFAANSGLDMSAFTGAQTGDNYAFMIRVGDVSKNVVVKFESGDTAQAAVNRALKDAFGVNNNNQGLVSVNAQGKITVSDGRSVAYTNIVKMSNEQKLAFDALNLERGNNSMILSIGDDSREVSFATLNKEFFDIFFDGGVFVGEAGKDAQIDKVAAQRHEAARNKAYDDWFNAATTTPSVQANMREQAFNVVFNKEINADFEAKRDAQWAIAYASDNTLKEAEWKAQWTRDNEKTIKDDFRAANETARRTDFFANTNVKESFDIVYNNNRFTSYEWVRESTQAEFDQRLSELENASLSSAYEAWLANPATTEAARDALFNEYFQYRLDLQQETAYNNARTVAFYKERDAAYSDYRNAAIAADETPLDMNEWKWENSGVEVTLENWDWGSVADGFSNWQDWRQSRIDVAAADDNNWDAFFNSEKTLAFNDARRAEYNAYVASLPSTVTPPSFANWEWRDTVTNQIITRDNWTGFEFADEAALKSATLAGANPFIGTGDDRQVNPNINERFDRFLRSTVEASRLDEELFRNIGYNEAEALKTMRPATVSTISAQDAVRVANEGNLKKAIAGLTFPDGVRLDVEFVGGEAVISAYTLDDDGNKVSAAVPIGITFNPNSVNTAATFNIPAEYKEQVATISTGSTLGALGVDFTDSNGVNVAQNLMINGASINTNANMTVNELINAVNSSNAGVTMTFSSLTNSFTIVAKEHGVAGKINFGDDAFSQAFAAQLGLNAPVKAGTNLELNVNGSNVETAGNSYTINGTTFRFENYVTEGTKFRVEVGSDNTAAFNAIKNFINDYNKLIEEVFGMTRERPHREYYFLTEHDIEESGLSDRQVLQWETMAKRGLLFNNSTVNSVMSGMRMAMLSSVLGSDGRQFGIVSIRGNSGAVAIQPSSDYKKNGMLELNEEALLEALERNPEDIMKLFTGENGIMANLEKELDKAISTKLIDAKGTREGSLIRMAGTATAANTENFLFSRIKSLNQSIDLLQARYERQQDRYWRMFSAMEKQFAAMNSQGNFIANMFNNNNNNNNNY